MTTIVATSAILTAPIVKAEGIYKAFDKSKEVAPEGLEITEDNRAGYEGSLAHRWRYGQVPGDPDTISIALDAFDMDEAAERLTKSHPALARELRDMRRGDEPDLNPPPTAGPWLA